VPPRYLGAVAGGLFLVLVGTARYIRPLIGGILRELVDLLLGGMAGLSGVAALTDWEAGSADLQLVAPRRDGLPDTPVVEVTPPDPPGCARAALYTLAVVVIFGLTSWIAVHLSVADGIWLAAGLTAVALAVAHRPPDVRGPKGWLMYLGTTVGIPMAILQPLIY
jgi:hypothetical protein